ncbi:MAG: hypothetical protein HC794_10375 [Nitrospiraceae bacterium]|nr:hypothetical protein [Nitrospiraceae bacterium]
MPDGTFVVADAGGNALWQIGYDLPDYSDNEILIPNASASEIYVFDSRGRHLRTVHALTGATLRSFAYDTRGLLSEIRDRNNLVTTIVRDADGVATAIDSPFGQRTALTQHADGYLASAANPAGETVSFLYSDGLMTQLTDPRGSVKNYSYSALGRLSQAADENIGPERGIQTYSRDRADGKPSYKVERRTLLGESTKYSVVKKRGGLEIRRQQYADGTVP